MSERLENPERRRTMAVEAEDYEVLADRARRLAASEKRRVTLAEAIHRALIEAGWVKEKRA